MNITTDELIRIISSVGGASAPSSEDDSETETEAESGLILDLAAAAARIEDKLDLLLTSEKGEGEVFAGGMATGGGLDVASAFTYDGAVDMTYNAGINFGGK